MNLIKISGANASGKSTRLFEYIKTLGDTYETLTYDWVSKGKNKSIVCGRLYPNGIFLGGRTVKDGDNWIGTDHLMGQLGTTDEAKDFFSWLKDNHNPHVVITEGYYGVDSKSLTTYTRIPKKDGGQLVESKWCMFDKVHNYMMVYKTLEDFVSRTESRSGSTWESRGKDPETSRGWTRNMTWTRALASGAMVERTTYLDVLCPFDTPLDYFIKEFNNHKLIYK